MKTMVKKMVFLSMLPLMAACAGGQKKVESVQEEKLPVVVAEQVNVRDVVQAGTYTSTVEANAKNNIAPQSAMRLKDILVDIGDFVKANQVVAKMDVISLDQAKLQYINDSTEYFRLKGLYDAGGLSKSDLDAIELAYKVRKKNYQNMLENTILRSPITGVISARNYDEGDMYAMAQPIYTVQQISPVKLLVAVSEKDYTRVKKGGKVQITVDAFPGEQFEGNISRLYPTIDPATHTFLVEVKVPNKDTKLRPGMFARVVIRYGVNHSVVIPDKAVVKQQGAGDRYVYVLNDDQTVTFQKVVLGVREGSEYEVLSGLKEGDKVVVEGQIRLQDGVKVELKK